MLALTLDEATRFEATLALAAVPDVRALSVYLAGLTDKSQDVRKAAAGALTAIRDEAAPVLERLGARRELSPSALPELRKVFNQFRPVRAWHLLGPLPLDAAPPVGPDAPVDLAAKVVAPTASTWPGARRGAKRSTARSTSRGSTPPTRGSARPSASAEVERRAARSARMLVGCDDRMTVWLNGGSVHKIDGNHSYAPDMAEFAVQLRPGRTCFWSGRSNDGGAWECSVAVTQLGRVRLPPGAGRRGLQPRQAPGGRLAGGGKADHGKALFADLKGLACVKCHAVEGREGAIGPNLSGIAAHVPPDELITSILAPSARIFSGYETAVVATADGRVLTGLIKSDTADGLEIEDADGKRIKLAPADVEERKTSDLSLMPSGIVEGISADDFADLDRLPRNPQKRRRQPGEARREVTSAHPGPGTTQRKPACDIPVSGVHPCRAEGR